MQLNDLAAWASVCALMVAVVSIAFSARRYLDIRGSDLKKDRFATYHRLIRTVSAGSDEHGIMKLVSQLAYVYELRNFPGYGDLTRELLSHLREEWARGEDDLRKAKLLEAIDETLAFLQGRITGRLSG